MKFGVFDFIEFFEGVWNKLKFFIMEKWDLFVENLGDSIWLVIQGFAKIIALSLKNLIDRVSSFESNSKLMSFVVKTIGLILAIVFWLFFQLIISLVATIGCLFGLRTGHMYTIKENILAWAPICIFVLAIPFGLSDYSTTQMVQICAYTLIALGLNILTGIGGQLSLGHSAFVLIGAYVAAAFSSGRAVAFEVPAPILVLLSGFIASLVGLCLGLPSLRVRGPYLGLVTFGLTVSLPKLMRSEYFEFLGRFDGITFDTLAPPTSIEMSQPMWQYFNHILVTGFLIYTAHILIRRTNVGRSWMAIRNGEEGEQRSKILGINVTSSKLLAFMCSAFYAGAGGGILAMTNGFISPDSFSLTDSLDYLSSIAIGGLGSVFGSVIAGVFLTYINELNNLMSAIIKNGEHLRWGIYGTLLIVIMVFFPKGIAGELRSLMLPLVSVLPKRRFHRYTPTPDFELEEELGMNLIPPEKHSEKNGR